MTKEVLRTLTNLSLVAGTLMLDIQNTPSSFLVYSGKFLFDFVL